MQRYVISGMGAEAAKAAVPSITLIPKDIDLEATIKSATQQMFDGYQQLRKDIWSITPTKVQESLLKALAVDLDNWRDRLLTFLEPWSTKWYDKLWLIGWVQKSWMLKTDQKAVFTGLIRFQKELDGFGKRFETITGQSQPSSTVPAPRPGATPGPLDALLDFGWDVLKLGAVGMVVWYGGKYLYNAIDPTYPKDRLPRYAGGRRRKSRRKS